MAKSRRRRPSTATGPDTRARLLDAAERLFAESGIGQTTLRQITAAAHANLAAVNYHFGSKRALLSEVFARRIQPVNEDRLARLESVERESGEQSADIADILRAFIEPAFALRHASNGQGAHFLRLMGRAHTDPSDELRDVVESQFEEVALSFALAIARAMPRLSPMEIHRRLRFSIGAMAFTMMNSDGPGTGASEDPDRALDDETRERLVSFLAAGFHADRGQSRTGTDAEGSK